MQCSYLITPDRRCKLRTRSLIGYCHRHKNKIHFTFPKPKNCPVCFCSIHQSKRPLECEHWVHRRCVEKSGKAQCPICRASLSDVNITSHPLDLTELIEELFTDPNFERIDIPGDTVTLAVMLYQLYAFIISPNNRILGLNHFISCMVNDIIPLDNPNHNSISAILYGEALSIYFGQQWMQGRQDEALRI